MPTVKHVERSIERVERFKVRFRYSGPGRSPGRDVRGDREHVRSYEYKRAAPDGSTVANWLRTRFAHNYPGFAADVLDASGRVVDGRTTLATVRRTYG